MRVEVCVPFRGGDKVRERNFEYVKAWWDELGYKVHVGDSDGRFNRAQARNRAASQSDADVLVFADADTVGDAKLVEKACTHAYKTGELSYPFTHFVGLSEPGTVEYMRSGRVAGVRTRVGPPKSSPGGILAIHQDLFEWAGGYDEAFTGWGYEDLAFACAARTLGGIHRLEGTIIHLWHPIAADKRVAIAGKTPNRARKDRYKQADGNLEAMLALIEELK
jgi:hypothetical protein